MTSCSELSERMAAAARGQPWSSRDEAHLDACPSCAAEWEIVRRTAELGRHLPELDPDRIAARVRSRLAAHPADVSPRVLPFAAARARRWVLGLAAAAMLVVAVRWVSEQPPSGPGLEAQSATVLTELDELTGAELQSVLDALSEGEPSAEEIPGLSDLSPDELERVLRSWES